MKSTFSISVIIPAFNEAMNLEAIVEDSNKNLMGLTSKYEIIVIDDLSMDSTKEKLSLFKNHSQ